MFQLFQNRSTARQRRCRRRGQSAAMPRLRLRRCNSYSSVTRMRAPLAPMGWPRATAPPFTFIFFGLSLSWRVTAMAATAKASFSSTRSTSLSRSQPVLVSNFSTGVDRGHHHPLGFDAADGLRDDSRNRRFFQGATRFARWSQSKRRRRRWCRGVASGDGTVFFEGGLQFCERFDAGVFAGRFVVFDDDGVAFFLRTSMGRICASKKQICGHAQLSGGFRQRTCPAPRA